MAKPAKDGLGLNFSDNRSAAGRDATALLQELPGY